MHDPITNDRVAFGTNSWLLFISIVEKTAVDHHDTEEVLHDTDEVVPLRYHDVGRTTVHHVLKHMQRLK